MIAEPRCWTRQCKHLTGVYQPNDDESIEKPTCTAFPKGIPRAIAWGNNDHTKPYPGDHGIQYEKRRESASAV
jgi:hypothetical protein